MEIPLDQYHLFNLTCLEMYLIIIYYYDNNRAIQTISTLSVFNQQLCLNKLGDQTVQHYINLTNKGTYFRLEKSHCSQLLKVFQMMAG